MGGCVLQELLAFTLYLFVVASQQKQVNGFLLDNKTENTYGIWKEWSSLPERKQQQPTGLKTVRHMVIFFFGYLLLEQGGKEVKFNIWKAAE